MSESKIIGYEHLVVRLGTEELDKNSIRELKIERRINDHVRFWATGVVGGDQKDKYAELAEVTTQITVDCVTPGGTTTLFKGVVTNITIKSVNEVYYFEIQGASKTYNLDVKRENRSFQDCRMTYRDFIDGVLENEKAVCNKTAVKDEILEQFLLQYNETKWEFLKRVASQSPFHTGLVADATGEKAQFWFGIPEGKERVVKDLTSRYSVHKKIAAFRESAANHHTQAGEQDFIEYDLTTDEFFDIGDSVVFKEQKLRVNRAVATMEGGILKFECGLTPAAGLRQNLISNHQLTGVSIEGKVIAVEKDNLKIALVGIGEKNQAPERACWFPYATMYTAEGHTGWYCMPEVGDFVRLTFPTHQESDAFITTSVRFREKDESGKTSPRKSGSDKIENPQIKYFRTSFGKEIMFSEKEILITGKDGELLVRLNEEKGIEILSPQAVTVTAQKDVTISSVEGTVAISAAAELDLICKSSSIKMDGETHLKGTQVKIN